MVRCYGSFPSILLISGRGDANRMHVRNAFNYAATQISNFTWKPVAFEAGKETGMPDSHCQPFAIRGTIAYHCDFISLHTALRDFFFEGSHYV